jgi:beta-hydroxyacyl-ACP dehydratase FabZ
MSVLAIREIMDRIPHRYPFLLVDRIVEHTNGQRVVAIKNVTMNEPFFQGHFPGAPVMPGVLIIEALAQAGAVLLLSDIPDRATKLVYFTGIDQARFRRPVVPGDQIRLTMEVLKLRARTCKMRGIAEVDGELVAEAEIMSALVDRP